MELPEEIVTFVYSEFSEDEVTEALSLLRNAKIYDGTDADFRMLRCALFSCSKIINGLRYQIDGLAHDYRDVILGGEYIKKKGEWVQVRDLSKPFQ